MANKFAFGEEFEDLLLDLEGNFNALDYCVQDMNESVSECLDVFEKFFDYHDEFFESFEELWDEYEDEIYSVKNMVLYVNGMASKFVFVKDRVVPAVSDIEDIEVDELVTRFENGFRMYQNIGMDVRKEIGRVSGR